MLFQGFNFGISSSNFGHTIGAPDKMVQIVDHLGTMNVTDSDENEQTLEEWYEDYIERNNLPRPALDDLKHDTFDLDIYHKDFEDEESEVKLSKDLCKNCQNLANSLARMIPSRAKGDGPNPIQQYRSCHELIISDQAGCHFCCLLMQHIRDHLMYFMKAERRLKHIGKDSAIYLILKDESASGNGFVLWINLPGIAVQMGMYRYSLSLSPVNESRYVYTVGSFH